MPCVDTENKIYLEQKATILHTYRERISLRGSQQVFGVWRTTLLGWLKARVADLPNLTDTLLSVQPDDVLELDELVSFVSETWFKRWLWLAMSRRTRQIVAFVIGDRSETTARKLWETIPAAYCTCPVFTNEFNIHPLIIPSTQHHPVPKGTGLINHQERWYNTLRQ